jgi:tRNA modification GTPase
VASVASILTPPGTAAIGVVRLAGPAAEVFAGRHLSVVPDYRPRHAKLTDAGEVIDDPLVLRRTDNSIELHLHGSPYLARRVIDLAVAAGCAEGEPPTPRTLDELVAAALPRALTRTVVRLLLDQPRRHRENLPPDDYPDTLRIALAVPRVAVIGRPNAGKSTLCNRLLGRDRFITSDTPGTTRDWADEVADAAGLPILLTDTPGRRLTDDAIEAAAIARSAEAIDVADLIVHVAAPDADEPPPPGSLAVWNKADLAPAPPDRLPVSAATGEGLTKFLARLHRQFRVDLQGPGTMTL